MKTRITELFGIEHPVIQGGMHYAENGIYNWIIRLKGYNTDAEEYTGTLQLMR
ncbi:MAG: hypothetical protein QF863_02415 [Pseudomonadales bacterium]|nr:hypothetical protein [Pseudomonadales bacterium]